MKRVFTLIILALTLTSCYKDQLREIHEQVTELRDIKLATLGKQADEISESINDLDKLTVELKQYVESLEKFSGDITKNLQNVTVLMETFKATAGSQISSSQKDLIDLIDKMNNSVDGKYKDLNAVIESLKEKDTAIEGQISSLKTYMDGLYATSDWANFTLATLDKQKEILKEVETIKTEITTLQESVKTLKEKLSAELDKALTSFKEEFEGELASAAEKITSELNDALAKMTEEVSSKFAEDVKNAVGDCEEGMKSWVNDKLTEYYTVASAQAQIEAFKLMIGNVPEGLNLQGEIEALQSELEQAEKDITEQYTKAIKEAVEKYEGRISDEMDRRLQTIDTEKLQPLAGRLTPIQNEITDLWKKSGELSDRINTVFEQSGKISESIAVLTELDKTLEQYVGEIVKKLEDADEANRKNLEGKLDDLKKVIETLQKNISDLKAYVGTLPEGVETDVTTWIQTTFSTLEAQFDDYATIASVDAIVNAINDRISGHDTDIAALNKTLDELIEKSKTTIEEWVSDKLKAYTTAEDADKLLETLESELTDIFTNGDKDLQDKIDAQKKALDDMKARIEDAYKKLIQESIETEQGVLIGSIKDAADKINDDVEGLMTKAEGIEDELDAMIEKVDELQDLVDYQKTELATLQDFLKANGYESLYEIVTDLISKIDVLSDQYADKTELDNLYTYVTTTLTSESGRIADLVSRMMAVTTTVSNMSSFLADTDMSSTSLKEILDEIIGKIDTLEEEVNGSESSPSLTAQVEALEVALYGEDKDPENPAPESVCGMINYLMNVLVTGSFSAITYVPRYFDQTEMLNFTKNDVSTSFNFMVKPSSISRFCNEDAFKACFKMRFVKDGVIYDFQEQEISGTEDGMITVDVRDSRVDLLSRGASAALYVTSEDEALPSFTSKFIPLSDINGSTNLFSNVGILRFAPEGGSKPVTITATQAFYVDSCPDWIALPEPDYEVLGRYCYNRCPDGKEFIITASNNSTFNSRVGDIVLVSLSTGDRLKIHIEQEGNKVLFTDIPASGGIFSDSKYTFTLTNKDVNYPYIYLSNRGGVILDSEILEWLGLYYLTVQYDDGTGSLKDFPHTMDTAIKASSITITIDASRFYLLLSSMSDQTRITFTTLSDPSSDALVGSSISFDVTRYNTLFVRDHNQTIR